MNRALTIITSCFLLTFLTAVSAMADAVSYAPDGFDNILIGGRDEQ
jgi:hypothetical protein